ncbi:hypothetical protein I6F21_38240, partial [Bradyrhizobium sp. NBAIM03]|nr:hypothetical protein [Bradyrhizobium sp. NBAIM03]
EQAQLNPLVHYLRFGRREGRVLPVSEAVTSPDAIGTSATGVPVPAAGSSGLLRADAQATQQGGQPAVQSALDAEVSAIRQSGLFDESYYLSVNPDLDLRPEDAIRHYCERGWREGRNPSDDFDTQYY